MDKPSIMPILMLLVNCVLGSVGQILLKFGSNKLSPIHSNQGFAASLFDSLKGILTPYVFLGFCVYGISSILWIRIIREVRLSFAYPMISISYIMVVLLSKVFFGDKITWTMSIGLLLICVGVSLIGIGYGGAVK